LAARIKNNTIAEYNVSVLLTNQHSVSRGYKKNGTKTKQA
jgi:hypothetical protein